MSATRLLLAILVLVLALFCGSRFFGVVEALLDVNGDGLVDVKDAIQIIDQNGDGQISPYELAPFLLVWLVGLCYVFGFLTPSSGTPE
jgi:hypothetical protein